MVFGLWSQAHLCCQACLATAIAAAGAEVPAANCRVSKSTLNVPTVGQCAVDSQLMHLFGTNSDVFGLWFKKMEQKVFRKQFLKERAYRKPPVSEHTKNWGKIAFFGFGKLKNVLLFWYSLKQLSNNKKSLLHWHSPVPGLPCFFSAWTNISNMQQVRG